MLILLLVSFAAGLVTVLSPCILPVLPIVLGSSVNGGRARPFAVVAGLIVSFSVFTLAAAQIVALLHLSSSVLRLAAILIIAILGLTLLVPQLSQWFERLTAGLPGLAGSGHAARGSGVWGGLLTGASLGLVWAPCAGPILAAVTTLAATQQVSAGAAAVLVAYALGAGVPMLGLAYGGRALAQRARGLARYGGRVQQVFGALMLVVAALMVFNLDVQFTVWSTTALAPGWTNTLQSIEQLTAVKTQLNDLTGHATSTPAPVVAGGVSATAGGPTAAGPLAPDFTGIDHWINSQPLTLAALRGKVVLVDFWTYSCINCLRTLPYTTAWYNKYKDQGFVVVGVHTPEFEFEHDTANVEQAVQRLNITYPVAQDNEYATWQAYNNEYWPAEYLIDANGVVRHTQFGEGDYDVTEQTIQQLLREKGAVVSQGLSSLPTAGYQPDETPETYLGTDRQQGFGSPQPVRPDQPQNFTIPASLPVNQFAVSGNWTFGAEYATVNSAGAKLQLHFIAKDVYLVLTSDQPVPVGINLLKPAEKNTSEDVDANGQITVSAARLYHLVQLQIAQEGTVELTFTQPGVRVYAFTFGD
jgi:cytochrome c biogenesis protein CcdA/thiol-disulfide isomerase/thioredoxin